MSFSLVKHKYPVQPKYLYMSHMPVSIHKQSVNRANCFRGNTGLIITR